MKVDFTPFDARSSSSLLEELEEIVQPFKANMKHDGMFVDSDIQCIRHNECPESTLTLATVAIVTE